MKKQGLIFLVSVVFLAILVVGCATTKQMELAENRINAMDVKSKITEEKIEQERIRLAEIRGYTFRLGERLDVVEKNDIALKTELGANKNLISLVAQRLENSETDLGAKIQGLEAEFRAGQKEYKNLKDFALARLQWLKKTVSLREAPPTKSNPKRQGRYLFPNP